MTKGQLFWKHPVPAEGTSMQRFICLYAGMLWLLWAYNCAVDFLSINVIESSFKRIANGLLHCICSACVYILKIRLKSCGVGCFNQQLWYIRCRIWGYQMITICALWRGNWWNDWIDLNAFCLKKQPYAMNVVIYVVGFVDLQAYALAEVNVSWFL